MWQTRPGFPCALLSFSEPSIHQFLNPEVSIVIAAGAPGVRIAHQKDICWALLPKGAQSISRVLSAFASSEAPSTGTFPVTSGLMVINGCSGSCSPMIQLQLRRWQGSMNAAHEVHHVWCLRILKGSFSVTLCFCLLLW